MQHFMCKPQGVCARLVEFDLDGDTVHNISFVGGCNGNLKAIGSICEGMTVAQIEKAFTGIDCGGKGTSCSDQLAKCLNQALQQVKG